MVPEMAKPDPPETGGLPGPAGVVQARCYTEKMFITRKQTKGSADRGAWPWRRFSAMV